MARGSLRFRIFKYTVYSLLAINILLFLIHGAPHEALDSLGWVLLLGTFEWETSSLDQDYSSSREKYALRAAQALGYALAVYATVSYLMVGAWADLVNATTWLIICAVLAYDVYAPGEYEDGEWRGPQLSEGHPLRRALRGGALVGL